MMKLSELVKDAGRRACADRGARRRQALEAGPGRCAGHGALHGVLRRRGRQGFRRDDSLSRRLHRLHLARAAWRDRPYRAVELSDADRRPHDRRGAGDGQRLRPEARGGSLPHFAGARRSRPRGRFSGRRPQHRPGPRRGGRRRARRASRRPASVVHRLGHGRGAGAGGGGASCRAGDAGTRRKVARSSCSPTPISSAPCRSWSTPAFRTPARPARLPRAFWSNASATTRSSNAWPSATAPCGSGQRRPTSTSAR